MQVRNEILIHFFDYFNICGHCEPFWKIQILGPLLKSKRVPFLQILGPLKIVEQCKIRFAPTAPRLKSCIFQWSLNQIVGILLVEIRSWRDRNLKIWPKLWSGSWLTLKRCIIPGKIWPKFGFGKNLLWLSGGVLWLKLKVHLKVKRRKAELWWAGH